MCLVNLNTEMHILNPNLLLNWMFVFRFFLYLNVAFLCDFFADRYIFDDGNKIYFSFLHSLLSIAYWKKVVLSLTILLQQPVTAAWFYNRELIVSNPYYSKS
jgi:hypothetical protein